MIFRGYKKQSGDTFQHRPIGSGLVKQVYSSSPRRRRGALPFLQAGHGEIAPAVSAAGGVEPCGTIQS